MIEPAFYELQQVQQVQGGEQQVMQLQPAAFDYNSQTKVPAGEQLVSSSYHSSTSKSVM